jgi:hypothetical protein
MLMLFMATAFCEIAPGYGTQYKSCSLKYAVKLHRKYRQKKNSIFCAIYFTLATLHIAQIG